MSTTRMFDLQDESPPSTRSWHYSHKPVKSLWPLDDGEYMVMMVYDYGKYCRWHPPINFTVPELPIPAFSCPTRRFASSAILHLCCVSFVLECYTLSSRRPGGESGCFLVSGGE